MTGMNARVLNIAGMANNVHKYLFFNRNKKIKNGSFYDSKTKFDSYFNVSKFTINPLKYNDLNDNITKLLQNRQCRQFPCVQKILDKNENFLNTRRKTLQEGCSAIQETLYPRMRWIELKAKYAYSKNFRVCRIPKVSMFKNCKL